MLLLLLLLLLLLVVLVALLVVVVVLFVVVVVVVVMVVVVLIVVVCMLVIGVCHRDTQFFCYAEAGMSQKQATALAIAGLAGVEYGAAMEGIHGYAGGYMTKGGKPTATHRRTAAEAARVVADRRPDASLHAVASQAARSMQSSMSIGRPEACFLLGGGKLWECSRQFHQGSLSTQRLEDVADDAAEVSATTVDGARRKYLRDRRGADPHAISFFEFLVEEWAPKVPHVTFKNAVSMPVDEDVAANYLLLYKPWCTADRDELRGGYPTFGRALFAFVNDPDSRCPLSVRGLVSEARSAHYLRQVREEQDKVHEEQRRQQGQNGQQHQQHQQQHQQQRQHQHQRQHQQHAARPLPFPRRQADRIHLALHAAAQNALVHPHHQARAREPPARHTPPDEPNEAEAAELLAAAGFDTEHLAGGLHEDDLAQLPNDPTRDWSVPLPDAVPSEWRTYTGAQIRACVAQWAEEHENKYRAEAPDTRLFLPVEVFHPSEAKPSQRPLIGLVLLTLYAWWRWAIDAGEAHTRGQRLPPAPQAVRAIVQGRPGTGKSWMIKTICNMVRQLTKDMGSCRTFGPTGTSASAIGGETVHRAAAPPMKKKDLHKPPQPLGVGCVTSAARVSALQRRFGPLWALLDDEFSMKAREMLGWLEFRCREGRPADVATFRASPAGNGEGEADWGLVPLVIETGDVLQLPAVAATACWDPVRAEVDTSDAVGRHVWDAIARDNVFVLDAVLRQVRAPRRRMQPACLL